MKSEFPSVLVLSPNTFNYLSGSGVTFSHLFAGWPKEKLANLYSDNEPSDSTVCEHFFRMGPAELHRPIFGKQNPSNSPGATATTTGSRSWKKKLAGNSGWPEYFRFSEKLDAWLNEHKPQVIYTILGPIPHMEAALAIRDRFGAKLVVHHMDDWYKDAYTTGLFRVRRNRMLKLFHSILEIADQRLAIGEDMASEYSARFSKEFHPFQNTIDVNEFRSSINHFSNPNQGGKKILLYFGSILPFAQRQSILDMAEATDALWKNNSASAPIFRIVAPKAQLEQLPSDFPKRRDLELIAMCNDPDQFSREIAQADALLLPANFDKAAIQHLRFSMPTKLPGYLSSGRPVLAYAPKELAQSRYLERHQIAEMVCERSESALKAGLERILTPSISQELADKALAVALRNHNSSTVRQQFQNLLKNLD